jgi:hypothetical protein
MKILEQHLRKMVHSIHVEDQNKVLIFSALGFETKKLNFRKLKSSFERNSFSVG